MPRLRTRLYLLVAASLAASALVVGCSGDDAEGGEPTATAAATEQAEGTAATGSSSGAETAEGVAVALNEWSVDPAGATAPAGEVTFEVGNEGASPHELVVVRTDEAVDALPTDGGMVDEEQVEVIGRTENVGAGESQTLTVDLEPGRYVLLCNLAGHYDLGMRAEFTVE